MKNQFYNKIVRSLIYPVDKGDRQPLLCVQRKFLQNKERENLSLVDTQSQPGTRLHPRCVRSRCLVSPHQLLDKNYKKFDYITKFQKIFF